MQMESDLTTQSAKQKPCRAKLELNTGLTFPMNLLVTVESISLLLEYQKQKVIRSAENKILTFLDSNLIIMELHVI